MSAVICEAKRLCDNERCTHPAKYLAPFDATAVCGTHARAFLRCIPIADLDGAVTEGQEEA